MSTSIIIPVYNGEKYLQRAVDSCLDQGKNQDNEIIIVDNLSTDRSAEIAKKLTAKHPSVAFYESQNQGSAYARNLGLEKAIGKWIQFLDVDDVILPNKLKKQVKVGDATNSDIVISPFTEITIEGKKIKTTILNSDPWLALISGRLGVTSSNLWRRNKLIEIGGWDANQNTHQDYLLLFSLLKADAKLCYLNEDVVNKYEIQNSISLSSSFPYDGVILRREIERHLDKNQLLKPKSIAALHNYYYDKTLWAHKLDPKKGQALLSKIDIVTNLAKKPWYHEIGLRLFGIEKWFYILSRN